MSEIKVDTVGPRVDNGTLTIGAAGDTVNIAGTAGTGFPAGTTINTNGNDRLITGSGTAGTLNGETRLLYNGDVLTQQASGSTTEFRQTVDGAGTYWSSLIASASDVKLYTRTASPLIFGCNNAEKMRITNDGKVGIGVTPTLALDISSTDPRIYMIDTTNAGSTYKTKFGQYNDTFLISTNDGANDAIKIYADGEVTKTLQPTFLVIPTADLTNMGTGNTTVAWDGEIFDVGSNFSSNTFTAPVTGKYQFNVSFYLANLDIDTTLFDVNMMASNRIQRLMARNIAKDFTADSTNLSSINASTLLDMDANDTVYVRIDITGGGGVIHLNGTAPASEFYTNWSGALIC